MAGKPKYRGPIPDGHAYCSGHKALHLVAEFPENSRKTNGLASWCRAYYAEFMRDKRAENPTAWRDYYLQRTFGITEAQFAALLKAQGGGCAVCGSVTAWADKAQLKNFSVDHDHNCCPGKVSCGKCVRGLLCNTCNRGLGQFRDDPSLLREAAEYLERMNARNQAAFAPG